MFRVLAHAPRLRRLVAAAVTLGGLYAGQAIADVFHFVAEDGTPSFSDRDSDPRFRLLLRTGGEALVPDARLPSDAVSSGRLRFDAEISAAAQSSRVDPALLHALIGVESSYNPRAVSPKGALGLMQLMPATARRYGVVDPLDAVQNLRGGARHLRELLDLFPGNMELALAAYNAGAGAVLAYGRRIPPYAETARYVPKVLRSYALLRKTAPGYTK